MVLYLIKDCKYAFEQLPVVEWVFSWFVLRRPARTCLLFQGRRDEVSGLRFPSAHDRMRLGEVTKVKGTWPFTRASETLSKNNQDHAFRLLSSFPATRPHYSSQACLWPLTFKGSKWTFGQYFSMTSQFLTMMRCSWYSGSAEFCCGVIVGHG